MDRRKRVCVYPGARIDVTPEMFNDFSLPVIERFPFKNHALVHDIVISTKQESCVVNWDEKFEIFLYFRQN